MRRELQAAWLAIREATSRPSLSRSPEPSAEMTGAESVRGFHDAGGKGGPLLGIYHLNARAIHQLVRRGGIVLDLGCGSGQFLAYLARRRPDLKLIGIDLSSEMIALGNEMLSDQGLSHRVELRKGDMTNFMDVVSGPLARAPACRGCRCRLARTGRCAAGRHQGWGSPRKPFGWTSRRSGPLGSKDKGADGPLVHSCGFVRDTLRPPARQGAAKESDG